MIDKIKKAVKKVVVKTKRQLPVTLTKKERMAKAKGFAK